MNKENEVNVICVQYKPKYKDPIANSKFLSELLTCYKKEDLIDMIVFPEMTLAGYIFSSKEDIEPYLEEYNKGPTFDLCSELSKRLNCYVFMGYAERLNDTLYNSCMITDRTGSSLFSYHKSFLFEKDKIWCVEGNGFGYLEITSHQGKKLKLGIGICMDINPYEFTSPWEKMEFSTHCFEKDVDIIVFLTNWTDEKPDVNTKEEMLDLINYWAARFKPFMNKNIKKKKYFLAADRIGKEFDTNYHGNSCILQITPKPSLLVCLDKKKQTTINSILRFDD